MTKKDLPEVGIPQRSSTLFDKTRFLKIKRFFENPEVKIVLSLIYLIRNSYSVY